jgi:cytochrome c
MSKERRWRWLGPALATALALVGATGAGAQAHMGRETDHDEDGQRTSLPSLPSGMTVAMIREGDALFHGKGACVTCHGAEATGLPNAGSALTAGLHFIPYEWGPIDSVVRGGIPEPVTRSSIAMPERPDLSAEESRRIAAYVWAISQVKGEPWPGGHQTHETTTAGAPRPPPQPRPTR